MARREEVHTTSEGLATVTIYDDTNGQVLGIGHGFTLSDARTQAQTRADAGEVVEAELAEDDEGEDICWACDGATDEQRHTCQRYPELTAADLETLDAPLAPANLSQLVADYLEANADDGDGPPSVWDFVLWNLYRDAPAHSATEYPARRSSASFDPEREGVIDPRDP